MNASSIKPLKKTLPLGDGEPATSLACRIATLWRAPSARLFWDDVGIPFGAIAKGDEKALRTLATVTDTSPEELLRNSPVRIDRATYRIGAETVPKRDLIRGRFRLCPACAQEDMKRHAHLRPDQSVHGRLTWHLVPIATCPRHDRSFVEISSDLPKHVGYHDFGLRVGENLHRIDALLERSESRPVSAFEQYYLDRIEGRQTSVPLLDELQLHNVSGGCLVFGRVSLFGPKRREADLSEHELYLAREEGYRILAQGSAGIGRLFRKLLVDTPERVSRSHTHVATLGHILGWLDRSTRDDADVDGLRTIVAQNIFATFPMAGGETLFGVTNVSPPMHTVHDIERRYGVNWITATRIGKLAGVLTNLRSGDAPGPQIIAAVDADRLFSQFVDVVSVTVLAKEIGATQKQLEALASAGFLKPAFDQRNVLLSFWRPDVDAFLERLSAKAVPVPARETSMASLRRAAWRSAPKLVELIAMIMDGQIEWLGRRSSDHLLDALLVRRKDLPAAKRKGPAGISSWEVSKRWRVKPEAIVGLIDQGDLIAHSRGSRGRQYAIDEESVRDFEKKYISLKALAVSRNEDRRRTYAIASRRGIQQTHPGLRGCFYRRTELQQAGLL